MAGRRFNRSSGDPRTRGNRRDFCRECFDQSCSRLANLPGLRPRGRQRTRSGRTRRSPRCPVSPLFRTKCDRRQKSSTVAPGAFRSGIQGSLSLRDGPCPARKGAWELRRGRGGARRGDGGIGWAGGGGGGFGYHSLFFPDGFTETFGELSTQIKNRLSHRARALGLARDFLIKIVDAPSTVQTYPPTDF